MTYFKSLPSQRPYWCHGMARGASAYAYQYERYDRWTGERFIVTVITLCKSMRGLRTHINQRQGTRQLVHGLPPVRILALFKITIK